MNQEDLNPLYVTPGGAGMRNTLWWSPFHYNVRLHEVSGFLLPYLITKASNYTCKSCGNKILQQYQIITEEPYRPTYHVKCYNELYESMINQITTFKISEIDNLIPDEDKKEL